MSTPEPSLGELRLQYENAKHAWREFQRQMFLLKTLGTVLFIEDSSFQEAYWLYFVEGCPGTAHALSDIADAIQNWRPPGDPLEDIYKLYE